MGQRTETFTSYIKDGKKVNNIYYNQWGIGRVQLMAIFGGFLSQIGNSRFDLNDCYGMRNEGKELLSEGENINDLDFSDITTIHEFIRYRCDNNNGGVVVIVDDDKMESKIGFVLGEEECYGTDEELASRFVPFEEWAEKVGGKYVDDSFKQMVYAFFEHFNFSVLTGELSKED